MTRKSTETAMEATPSPDKGNVPAKAETPAVSLPSPNLRHESVLVRELTSRLDQFDTALEVVVAEREGKILRYEQEAAEREEKHRLEISELDRQAEDIERGRKRLKKALEEDENNSG